MLLICRYCDADSLIPADIVDMDAPRSRALRMPDRAIYSLRADPLAFGHEANVHCSGQLGFSSSEAIIRVARNDGEDVRICQLVRAACDLALQVGFREIS